MADSKNIFTVGYGQNGVTGPTTPNLASPVVGGRSWPYEIVTRGYETVAIFPAWDVGGFGSPVHDIEPAKAYARKFAAVDELLVALKLLQTQALQSELNSPNHEWGMAALELTKAAIARAEGRS